MVYYSKVVDVWLLCHKQNLLALVFETKFKTVDRLLCLVDKKVDIWVILLYLPIYIKIVITWNVQDGPDSRFLKFNCHQKRELELFHHFYMGAQKG